MKEVLYLDRPRRYFFMDSPLYTMLPTRSVMWYCLHTNKWAYGVLYYIIKSSKHMVHGCAKDCTVDVVGLL
jgi:hypothetical protein